MASNTRFGLVVLAAFSGGVFGSWLFAPHTADAAAAAQAATGPQSASGQPTASQAITATANLPTIINVPPQGLIFRGSSGRTLARIDEVQNGANFDGKLTLPETDGAGRTASAAKMFTSAGVATPPF